MWHSIPACLACGLVAFLIVAGNDIAIRTFKACAVSLGFFSHLLIDEIWSLRLRSGRLNIKKSFGTALKFFSGSSSANLMVYGTLGLLGLLAVGDPMLMHRFGYEVKFGPHTAQQVVDQALRYAGVQEEAAASGEETIQR
jgi:hypothetical protein